MPNITFAQAAAALGIAGGQLNQLMRNPACPAPTSNPGTGIANILFDQTAITNLAATLAAAKANGWQVGTGAQLAAANLTAMAAAPPGPGYRPALSDVLFDDFP